jgi:hypothetical protein
MTLLIMVDFVRCKRCQVDARTQARVSEVVVDEDLD